jgi:hypothetical protein
MDRLVFSIIASYLTDVECILTLDLVCSNTHGHCSNYDTLKNIVLKSKNSDERFLYACKLGYINGIKRWYPIKVNYDDYWDDRVDITSLLYTCINHDIEGVKYLLNRELVPKDTDAFGNFIGQVIDQGCNSLIILKLLYSYFTPLNTTYNASRYISGIRSGNLDVIAWMEDLKYNEIFKLNPEFVCNYIDCYKILFPKYFIQGNIDRVINNMLNDDFESTHHEAIIWTMETYPDTLFHCNEPYKFFRKLMVESYDEASWLVMNLIITKQKIDPFTLIYQFFDRLIIDINPGRVCNLRKYVELYTINVIDLYQEFKDKKVAQRHIRNYFPFI